MYKLQIFFENHRLHRFDVNDEISNSVILPCTTVRELLVRLLKHIGS